MKTWLFTISLAAIVASLTFFIACTPQERNNQFDPGGTAGSNLSSVSFPSTAMKITPPVNAWDKNIGLDWPKATGAINYRVFISTSATRPTTPAIDNLTVTNANGSLMGPGTNHIWIEAVGSTTNSAAFLQTNFIVPSGFKIDTAIGYASSPSLRCVNVPAGSFRAIRFTFPSISGGSSAMEWSNAFQCSNWNGGTLSFSVKVWESGVPATFIEKGTSFTANQTAWAFQNWGMQPTTLAIGNFTYLVTVSNLSDTDGMNVFWIDTICIKGAMENQMVFTNMSDSDLTVP